MHKRSRFRPPVSGIGVLRFDRDYKLFSTACISEGTRVFRIDGELTTVPTRHTVQIGHGLHVDMPRGYSSADVLDRLHWRFVNHCWQPKLGKRDREAFALTTIPPFHEITFHYNTTEYEMAEPFDCHCESFHCEGRIQGFRFLSRGGQERLRPWLASHLLRLLTAREAVH